MEQGSEWGYLQPRADWEKPHPPQLSLLPLPTLPLPPRHPECALWSNMSEESGKWGQCGRDGGHVGSIWRSLLALGGRVGPPMSKVTACTTEGMGEG